MIEIKENNGGMLAIDYTNLIGHLIAGVKDLYNKVDQQQKEIVELKSSFPEICPYCGYKVDMEKLDVCEGI